MKAAPTPQDKWLQGIPRGWDGIPWEWGPCLLPAMGPPLWGGGARSGSPAQRWGGCVGQVRGMARGAAPGMDPGKMRLQLLRCISSPAPAMRAAGSEPWSSADFSSEGFHLFSLLVRAGKAFL